jgi:hypothetical protein
MASSFYHPNAAQIGFVLLKFDAYCPRKKASER